ncbi:2-polyprenylphenol 6-hydroxylase [Rhodobacteraceae bacterium NNCM2]|nr:2-polyprenylphenol 6-hydroxylase [Coraliihabitans acroporae]
MSAPAHLWRLLRTGATFERTGALVELLDAFAIRGWPRFAIRLITKPVGVFGRKGDPSLPPIARAIQAMGPAYVKFGQILSTRPDVTGDEVEKQLRFLQDRLPPFPRDQAAAILQNELGAKGAALIKDFGEPVAAASIAQVHPAIWAETGEKVAVKVLRPGVDRQFRRDIGAFYFIAGFVDALVPGAKRLRPKDVVAHFEGVVNMELDLRLEAAAASEFRENTLEDHRLHVPKVMWEGCSRRVMTQEWVGGVPLDPKRLAEEGHDLTAIGQNIISTFLRHALRDGFFHADMHQGNLRIAPDGTLLVLDFGIMGRLDPVTRRHYAEILYGFLTRNYRRVAEVHFEAGYVPPDRDVEKFAQALRAIGEPIFDENISQISMANLLAYLFETTERFGMETRTELILLQRTMVVVEGVARSLDPDSNIFEAARPVVESWIKENLGPPQLARDLFETAKILSRLGPRLPGLANELVMLAEEARTRRAHPPPPPPPPPKRWPWAVGGVLAGGALMAAILSWAA